MLAPTAIQSLVDVHEMSFRYEIPLGRLSGFQMAPPSVVAATAGLLVPGETAPTT
jgi:hypothetical protein